MNTRVMSSLALLAATCLTAGEVVIKDGDSIAFLGDSLTQLGYVHKPNGYIHLVIEGLQAAGVNAVPIPAGIGGNTTRHMLARLEKDVIAKKPVWMTLNSGINDAGPLSVEEFGANIAKIVDQAGAAGINVILMTTTVGAGENLDAPSSLKCLKFCEEFKKLAKERHLLLVDLNTVMAKELAARKQDGVKGLKLTYDGTHLNGLGNQIVAAEILRTLGVSDTHIAALRKRWDDYPFAVAMPEVSVNEYVKLKAAADKSGRSIDEQVSWILTQSMK
jgi:lysophospholipase L1-like esterase